MKHTPVAALLLAILCLFPNPIRAIDYSDPGNWISRPDADKPVDVIYLYPTAWMPNPGDPMYCDIDNSQMRGQATAIYGEQATAFGTAANVFAPFYRQMNINLTLGAGLTNDQIEGHLSAVPVEDVIESLDYYFANCNNGRPFILAGHSQGTQVMMLAMTGYFTLHPELKDRMIASYLIGYSVTDQLLKDTGLPFAQGADDTGVVISWNTEAPGTTGSPVILPGALAINPLNWMRDGAYAGPGENLGGTVPGVAADAWIHFDSATGTETINTNAVLPAGTPPCSME